MTVNGKDGVTKKKLICKCGSKCKWKNEKNKKINKATYQKWKCEGTPDETTPEATTTPVPDGGADAFQALSDSIAPGLQSCGMAGGSKIVNGVQAEENSWPWIVEFFMRDAPGSNMGYTCGGTIIDEHWVITAAHCVLDNAGNKLGGFIGTFAQWRSSKDDDGEFSMEAPPENVWVHPLYGQGSGNNHDVALIRYDNSIFEKAVKKGAAGKVAAACMPCMDYVPGDACWVAGWGTLEQGGNTPSKLQSVGVNLFSQEYCAANTLYSSIQDDEICAGLPDGNGDGLTDGGKDSCQGDSGGPLICNINGMATLTGIVSWGQGCANKGLPGVYGNVAHYSDWIYPTMAENPVGGTTQPTAAPEPEPEPEPEPVEGFEELSDSIPSNLTNCGHPGGSKIVNGVAAEPNSWPWIVNFFITETAGASSGYTCGGTILNEHWVLTAAHCVLDFDGNKLADFVANFAQHRTAGDDANEFSMKVGPENVFVHPNYGSSTNFDVALIRYDNSIFTKAMNKGAEDKVAAACMPVNDYTPGDACWVAGWGTLTENGSMPNKLQSVGVNLFSSDYCADYTEYGASINPDEICAGLPDMDGDGLTDGGKDSCQGDSGGPLICEVDGRATITGIVSWGAGCAGKGLPGVYGNVYQYGEWLETTMANNPVGGNDSDDSGSDPTEAPVTEAPAQDGPMQERTDHIESGLQYCSSAQSKIVNGVGAEENSWPAIVNFFIRSEPGSNSGYTCGGTIINENWVLTAAHCCLGSQGEILGGFVGQFAQWRTTKDDEGEFAMEAGPENVFVHPGYSQDDTNFDVCLVKYDQSIFAAALQNGAEDKVAAACLPSADYTHGDACWVAGWGTTEENGSSPSKLQSIGVNLFSGRFLYGPVNCHES